MKFQERLKTATENALQSKVVSPDNFRIEDGKYVHRGHEQGKIWDAAYDALKILVREATTVKVVALVGVPGAGKSTWLSNNAQKGVVYFDATLTGARDRKKFLTRVRTAGFKGEIEAVCINTPLDVCKSRNAQRTSDRKVPEHVLDAMHSKLSDQPPVKGEGWDKVTMINPG